MQVGKAKKDKTGTGQDTGNSIYVRDEEAKVTMPEIGATPHHSQSSLRAECSYPQQKLSQGQAYKARL